MNLREIITTRRYNHWPSWHIVFEWEDTFAKEMDLTLFYDSLFLKAMRHISPRLCRCLFPSHPSLLFQMSPEMNLDRAGRYNQRKIIPYIIDFFLQEKELPFFYRAYSQNPFVLISSQEVSNYLKRKNCPIPFFCLPLSLPDKYRLEPTEKKYDLILAGRTNPVLEEYTKRYAESNPDFLYVYRKLIDGVFNYYTSQGECLGNIRGRDQYMHLLRQSRVGLYATPGMDGGEERTHGFNQVTPRFLEMVASGCHVLARYPDNADTRYYELSKFSPPIQSYGQFKALMDEARKHEIDAVAYEAYLSKHYTSVRCDELRSIAKEAGI